MGGFSCLSRKTSRLSTNNSEKITNLACRNTAHFVQLFISDIPHLHNLRVYLSPTDEDIIHLHLAAPLSIKGEEALQLMIVSTLGELLSTKAPAP